MKTLQQIEKLMQHAKEHDNIFYYEALKLIKEHYLKEIKTSNNDRN